MNAEKDLKLANIQFSGKLLCWSVACVQAIDRIYKQKSLTSFTPRTLFALEGEEIMRATGSKSRNQIQSIRSTLYDLEQAGLLNRSRFEFTVQKEIWDTKVNTFIKQKTITTL